MPLRGGEEAALTGRRKGGMELLAGEVQPQSAPSPALLT